MKLWPNIRTGRIYADAAAATPLSRAVEREISRLLGLFGNPGGLHREALAAKRELEEAREKIAATLGAHADEIIFTASGTEANNLAVSGVLKLLLNRGERVHAITSTVEHSSVLEPLRALVEEGLLLTELGVDEEGRVDLKELREAVTDDTAFVSIQMINSEIGTLQNVREIAKVVRHARKNRGSAEGALPLYLHTDASQAPLWMELKVEKLGVDMMTLDAQKMLGPKGVGVLYVRRGTRLTPLIYGGGQEMGVRSGTENVVLAGALAVALVEAQKGVAERAEKIARVRDTLFNEIKKLIPAVVLNGATGEERAPNNLNISIPNLNGDMAVVAMDAEGVAISTRSACDTSEEAPSHVLAAIGKSAEEAKTAIRITLLPAATVREAKQIAKKLKTVADRYTSQK